ncbi:MAG TPA: cation-translocating P-type ATPase [Steroidobacteraceae bacterium]|nr:cation-translocating P-type ATPase [Steroidobacteraceae bacterium]
MEHRHEAGHTHARAEPHEARHAHVEPSAPDAVLRAKITGMDCGSCALTIEDGLRQLPGVRRVAVTFTSESLEVEGSATREAIEHRLRQLGYGLATPGETTPQASHSAAPASGVFRFFASEPQQRLALTAGAACLIAATVSYLSPAAPTGSLQRLVQIATVVLVGMPIFMKGARALLFSRRINIDLLMTLAAIGALFIGAASEGAAVVVLFTLGEGLERFSAARARDSLRSLLALQPQTATLLERHGQARGAEITRSAHVHAGEKHDHDQNLGHDHDHDHHDHDHDAVRDDDHNHELSGCGQGAGEHVHSRQVPAVDLVRGNVILVRPGERIAADGVVKNGRSSVNQAAVTGESIPVEKSIGDAVLSGTVNAEGALEVEVTREASDSTVARIARLVEEAQARRSPAERLVDRFARWYTPAVVALAILLVAIPVLGFDQPLLTAPGAAEGWLYRALALLIVACPCALVISIPVTVVSSLTRLAHLGVLVKGGEQLDRLATIRTVAFDKTGTLTWGRPSVTAIQASDCEHEPRPEAVCASCDDVIALAASVERSSEHPIAHAIVESARERGLQHRYPPASGVVAATGRGVIGEIAGARVAVGTAALMEDHGASASEQRFGAFDSERQTVMMVARDSRIVGAIGVQDSLRPESREVLAELRQTIPGLRTAMLTGDSERTALSVAASLGTVDEVRAGLLPADKLAAVTELQSTHGPVAMVGDGINDAPALARADVGIAMGAGTGQAMETADVVLMQDDLARLPSALRVARRNRAVVRQNIALSLGLKLAFLALTIPGLATLWLAVVADVGATLLVTLNGMRMLRAR